MTRQGTILLFIESLVCLLIFTFHSKKKKYFPIRLLLCITIGLLLAYILPSPKDVNDTIWFYAYLREIYIVVLLYLIIFISFDISSKNILYVLALALLVNEAGHALISIYRASKYFPTFTIFNLNNVHSFELIFFAFYYFLLGIISLFIKEKDKFYDSGYNHLNIAIIVIFLINNLVKRLPYMLDEAENMSVWIFEFLFILVTIIMYFLFYNYMVLKNEKDIIEQMNKDSYKQYEMTKETIESINIKCHDLKHKLYAEALKEKDKNEIEELIEMYDDSIKSGNQVIDYILMDYKLRNKDKNVSFSFVGDATNLNFIKEIDIYNLFSNALENSIEAVLKLEINKRIITINCETKGDIVYLNIRNYYNNQLKFSNNNIVTSKNNDNNEHGFGIKSMKCIAHKYNGDIYINHNNNIFSLTLYFKLSI